MKRFCFIALLLLLVSSPLFADTEDTAVFRTRLLPDNEVPPISAAGNSASATITVHAGRDARGNINSASVTFDIDYTVTAALTFTGLHIHNALTGVNGSIVIDTGLSGSNPVAVAAGSGRISRTVNYSATDTTGLGWVTGLLAVPENYYVNIHTTTNPGGFMRGQLQATHLVLRPMLHPSFEVPPVQIDAEGAALVDITVNRDANGAITSGTVVFDVNYRFPVGPVTLTGLHLHNAAAGANGPIVIDSGLNDTTRAVTIAGGVGNIFRIAEIPSTDTAGIAALAGLMADPTQFYINLHTAVNPGGVMRGQLSKNLYVFFNTMNGAEEVPPTTTGAIAYSSTRVSVNRDSTGNIASGSVSFNLNFNMNGGPVTFTGLHIHNAKFGVNGSVVIGTNIGSGAASVVSDTGIGSITRDVAIDSSSTQVALDSLRGLIQNPELYYVNIHTTVFTGGIIRAQLAQETYHFKANMSTANEVPPITTATTSGTGWITAKVNRDGNAAIVGGTVTFDVDFVNNGPITFTGLHIHHPGVAGVNASVAINTGIGSGATSVDSQTGSGNITRVVPIDATVATQLAAFSALITAPDTAYVNLHTTTFTGGVVRSQMFPVVNVVPQAVGGGSWLTALTLTNPSATTAVQGIADFFQTNGSAMPEAITDPNISFLIPPSGSVTITTSNAGALTGGFARVFSNGTVNVGARYNHPLFTSAPSSATTVTSRSVSLPVAVGANQNTGIAILAGSAGTLTLSLRDSTGNVIAGGSRTVDVTAGQQVAAFVRELLPGVTQTQFTGTLTITTSAGTISVLALQFDGSMTPVTVTALP